MYICQKKIADALNLVKYLNEKINDYKTHNKQIKVFTDNEFKQILTLIRNVFFSNCLNYSFPLAITFNHINNTLLYNSFLNISKETININNYLETNKFVYGPNIFETKINDNNINLFNTSGITLSNITQRYLPYTSYDLRIKNNLDLNNNSSLINKS